MRVKLNQLRKKLRPLFKPETLAFWALLTLVISGCTTDSEIVLPAATPKLVVNSFISPEAKRVEVSVSSSVALISPENNGQIKVITDALVWLSDGTDSVQLAYNDSSLYVSSALAILPGKRYSLRASTPSGYSVSAFCTVPVKINQSLTGRIDSASTGTQADTGNYALELRWQDLPGEGDFYRVEGISEARIVGSTGTMLRHKALTFLDEPQTKDAGSDGRSWQLTTETIPDYREEQRNGTLRKIKGYLYTTDFAYYEFHRTLYHYQLSNDFTDPVKIYSNVKGGLGIFGAYRMYEIDLPVR